MKTRTNEQEDMDFNRPLGIDSGFFAQQLPPPPLVVPRGKRMSRPARIAIGAFVIALLASVSVVAIALTLEEEDPVEAAKWRTIREVTAKLAEIKARMAAEAEAEPDPVEPVAEPEVELEASASAEPTAGSSISRAEEPGPVKKPVFKKTVDKKPVEKKPVEKKPIEAAPEPRDDLDKLINPGVSPNKPTELQKTLSRNQVQAGMSQVSGSVRSCGAGQGGTLTVSVTIKGNGKVASAAVIGTHAGTSVGACATRYVRRASFPEFADPTLRVKYPFSL